MSGCDSCGTPGNCCRGFVLQRWFDSDNWKREASDLMRSRGLEFFVAVRPVPYGGYLGLTAVMFDCTRLGDDGRCTQYDGRPDTCRLYQPGDDALCAEYTQKLKGIPIKVERK